jgi:hypothetical protein
MPMSWRQAPGPCDRLCGPCGEGFGFRQRSQGDIDWYSSEPRLAFSKHVVLRYRLERESRHLAASTINLRLAAVRRLAYEAADTGRRLGEFGKLANLVGSAGSLTSRRARLGR